MIYLYAIGAAAAAVAVAVYQYFLWQAEYWRRRGVPGPPSRLFYGNLKDLTKFEDPLPLKLHEWTKKYGSVYGFKEGVRNSLVISDIEMINEVFVKQFDAFYARPTPPLSQDLDNDPRVHLFESRGSRWKRLRALSAPSFTINSIKKMQPIIEDSAVKMVDLMGQKHSDGESFDVHRFFDEFSLDITCRLVLGQKESHLFENHLLEYLTAIFLLRADTPMTYIKYSFPQFPKVLRMVTRIIFTVHPSSSMAFIKRVFSIFAEIETTVKKRVEERKKFGPPTAPADFIDIFLESEAEFEFQNRGEFSAADSITKAITVDEVISQGYVFLLAGYDTTSNALAYTAWTLSRHPEVMKRCQEEIDEECRDVSISYEDTQKLRYLDAVCRETHRFYPFGARSLARACTNDTRIGGYEVEKGTTVIADTYAIHFSRELWGEDADEFKPERWLDQSRRVGALNFLSFGAGPRVCIGMRLAMMEEKLALAHLLRRFDILADETVSDLKLVGCTSVTPERVPIRIQPRQ